MRSAWTGLLAAKAHLYTVIVNSGLILFGNEDPWGVMCTKVIHKYSCGHKKIDHAPCAGKKGNSCKGVKELTHEHNEKCDECGG